MRQGQNKRSRGRNRKGPNPLTRSYESNGPDVKIRGTALHIADKYAQLARDAQVSGNRVQGESLLQHAEHYYRIVAAAQAQMPQSQPPVRNDEDGSGDEDRKSGNGHDRDRSVQQEGQPAFGLSDPQPHVNGGNGSAQDGTGGEGPEPGSNKQDQNARKDDSRGRQRRRRPYRERSNEQGEPGQETADAPPAPPVAKAEASGDKAATTGED